MRDGTPEGEVAVPHDERPHGAERGGLRRAGVDDDLRADRAYVGDGGGVEGAAGGGDVELRGDRSPLGDGGGDRRGALAALGAETGNRPARWVEGHGDLHGRSGGGP